MGEDTFVIKVEVQNKDNNVKVVKKSKDIKEEELQDQLLQDANDVLRLINK